MVQTKGKSDLTHITDIADIDLSAYHVNSSETKKIPGQGSQSVPDLLIPVSCRSRGPTPAFKERVKACRRAINRMTPMPSAMLKRQNRLSTSHSGDAFS